MSSGAFHVGNHAGFEEQWYAENPGLWSRARGETEEVTKDSGGWIPQHDLKFLRFETASIWIYTDENKRQSSSWIYNLNTKVVLTDQNLSDLIQTAFTCTTRGPQSPTLTEFMLMLLLCCHCDYLTIELWWYYIRCSLKSSVCVLSAWVWLIPGECVAQINRSSGSSDVKLRVSLENLLAAEHVGRWWIVGSSWSGAPMISHQGNTTSAQSASQGQVR